MRPAHPIFLTTTAVAALAALSLPAQSGTPAQATPSTAADKVFSPSAPTLPLRHQPLAASGAIVAQPGDWKAANAAVAEFPRGHADVLKWEKARAAAAGQPAGMAAPSHGGQP
ncbi:hypothetical protein [Comamonas guangdongensis]|uniref:DUF4148 domain-containing protein n=1 Tax=Comamonas guangdongensis TaxID=510515 RepID=A0ABV3ZXN3_9BURK